jgi:hypothetical protein
MKKLLNYKEFITESNSFYKSPLLNEDNTFYNFSKDFSANIREKFYNKLVKRFAGKNKDMNNENVKELMKFIWDENFSNLLKSDTFLSLFDKNENLFYQHSNSIRTFKFQIPESKEMNLKDPSIIKSIAKQDKLQEILGKVPNIKSEIKSALDSLEYKNNFIKDLKNELNNNSNIKQLIKTISYNPSDYTEAGMSITKLNKEKGDTSILAQIIESYENSPGFKESKQTNSQIEGKNLIWYILSDLAKSVYETYTDGLFVNISESIEYIPVSGTDLKDKTDSIGTQQVANAKTKRVYRGSRETVDREVTASDIDLSKFGY